MALARLHSGGSSAFSTTKHEQKQDDRAEEKTAPGGRIAVFRITPKYPIKPT